MCETEKVVEVSLEHLEEWGGREVMKDPRFELVVGDAYAWILNCKVKFDCVIMDISDPIEAGPGIMLYTKYQPRPDPNDPALRRQYTTCAWV